MLLLNSSFCVVNLCAPKLLNRLKCESKVQTTKEQEVEARSLVRNTLGVEGRVGALGWDYEE